MKRKLLGVVTAIFLAGIFSTVQAESRDNASSKQMGTPAGAHAGHHKEMGGSKDMTHRMEMMKRSGASTEAIHEWTVLFNAPLYMNSPAALLSEAAGLGLTPEQKHKLQIIDKEARERAMKVLTPEQKAKLGKIPDQPKTMMQIHKAMAERMTPKGNRPVMKEKSKAGD